MSTSANHKPHFEPAQIAALLQDCGIRPSAQRIAVMSVVANGRRHPTADEIFVRLSATFQSLSRTTVYNSLHALVGAGLLSELEIESGNARYDLGLQPAHSHFLCRRCGTITDMPMPDGVADVVAADFAVDSAEVCFKGLCPVCKAMETDINNQ